MTLVPPVPPIQMEQGALRQDKSDETTVAAAEVGAKFAAGVVVGAALIAPVGVGFVGGAGVGVAPVAR